MAKNIKRYKRECQVSGQVIPGLLIFQCKSNNPDFIPATFSLPADYRLFVEEYKRFFTLFLTEWKKSKFYVDIKTIQ